MSITLRPACPGDLPALFRIWKDAVEATHDFVTPEDRQDIAKLVRDSYLPSARLIVAEAPDGTPLGFLGGPPGEIEGLFVDPVAHRQGVGRALVRRAMAEAAEVRLDVNEPNCGAIRFYEALGFGRTGRSDTDGQGRPYPLIHMLWRRDQEAAR